ncbi:XRE family transcriptional regulator [Pseudonocardia sp. TMWB2A]|uniref:XRE family transcriptional regulator n=1 Tax=Pseudonocardia sp. TMWB2A TaxID=687430 RepID=UPI00307CE15F
MTESDANASDAAAPSERATLAEKLNALFANIVDPATGRPYSNPGAATAIERMVEALPEADRAGRVISQQYIWQLRKGAKTNPTVKHLESLGALFGVGADYFLNESRYQQVARELETLKTLQETGVEQLALRARDLSPAGLAAVEAALEHARSLEGLPPRREDPTGLDKKRRTY